MSQCPSVDSLIFFIVQQPIIESQGFYSNQIKGELILKVKIIRVLYKYPVLRTNLVTYFDFFVLFKNAVWINKPTSASE